MNHSTTIVQQYVKSVPLPIQVPVATRLAKGAFVVAAVALAIQAGHFAEHIAQIGYWFAHPLEAPWMTPWAMAAVHGLSVGGNHALGMELLHLIGNVIFMAGLGALAVAYTARGYASTEFRNLRIALTIQGIHLLEHITLTLTVIFAGRAIGVSTFIGGIEGPLLSSWRVWFHFLINLFASWYALRAVLDLKLQSTSTKFQITNSAKVPRMKVRIPGRFLRGPRGKNQQSKTIIP